MDEQAGPGVFFNNNNNSALAGGAKAVQQPGDGGGEAVRAQYNIPGILHFLQHEWARFEVERAQWDVERAELQVIPLDIFGNCLCAMIPCLFLSLHLSPAPFYHASVGFGNDVKNAAHLDTALNFTFTSLIRLISLQKLLL